MERAHQAFELSPQATAGARSFARSVAQRWGLRPDDIVLVVSELASNAVRHAGSGFEVCLQRRGSTLFIEVSDQSRQLIPPEVPATKVDAIGGRGLMIVAGLASVWGSRPEPLGGKTVWAELDLG